MQKKQQQKVEEEMWVNKNVRKHVSEKLIPQDRKTFLEHLKYKGCVCVCVWNIWETGEKEVGVENEVGGFKDLLEVGKRWGHFWMLAANTKRIVQASRALLD